MDQPSVSQAFHDLFDWCRERSFAGHDPYDALNSGLFQALAFTGSRNARLLWTQLIKRAPVNLRGLVRVPEEKNSKGIALFALAALANHRRVRTAESEADARYLINELAGMKLEGYRGAAWGYNFDWQSRNFFAPRGTATIVPTAFAARAFVEGFETLRDETYLRVARDACDFIVKDLNRPVENDDEVCFSYSSLDQTQIFNASLFAAETLASVGRLSGEPDLIELAIRAARFVARHQHRDGSWPYGSAATQTWIDNFHTAYVLISLNRIVESSGERGDEFKPALLRGFEFWKKSFFLADGWPKYYHDRLYPADAHAAATAIVAFVELRHLADDALAQAKRTAEWSIRSLRDSRGFFYYQRRRFQTIRTPFMRWTQAWMLYALARLLEAEEIS